VKDGGVDGKDVEEVKDGGVGGLGVRGLRIGVTSET
jgi:hypothetical protein